MSGGDSGNPGDNGSQDRSRGALLGLAVGDAIGTTVEFKPRGQFHPLSDMVGGGPFQLDPGQWTDDTSMALCLAESLVDCGGHDAADQMRRYLLWHERGYLSSTGTCFDIGITTRQQLARFKRTGEAHDPEVDEAAAANGSLMRLAPVSIRWFCEPDTVMAMAAESSRPTHNATRPVDACRVLASMTAALIRGERWDSVAASRCMHHAVLHPEVAAVVAGSWKTKRRDEIRGSGFCVESLEAAIWSVDAAGDFREAVLNAANLGNDADTTAAIAGQLAGARFGAIGIPSAWRDRLTLRTRIESLADALHAAATGRPSRWGHDTTLHAWWIEPGRILAGEYPASPDPALHGVKLALLADAGIRTIVDLASPGDGRAAYDVDWTAIAEIRGLSFKRVHHPIPDLGVVDDKGFQAIVNDIDREFADGRGVYVHCWGGVGRTGTVAGIWHVSRGRSVDEALTAIAEARRGTRKASRQCPEMECQLEAIHRASVGRRTAK